MNRSTQLGRRAGALLCAFALAFAGNALASGANSQHTANNGGGILTDGSDGLRVTWGSNSQFQVRLGGADQVYNTGATPTGGNLYNSIYLRVDRGAGAVRVYNNANNAATAAFNQFTQVLQTTLSGNGSVASPYQTTTTLRPNNAADSGITVTILDSYISPQAWFTRRVTLSGMPANGASIKFYQNIDTYLQGGDNGPGFSRTTPGNTTGRPDLVGVAKGTQFEALWWEPSSGTPNWDQYFSGTYTWPQWRICNGGNTTTGACTVAGGDLGNTVDTNANVDNGIAAQWNIPSGASTFTAEYRVTFALTSVDLVKRFAPATINVGGVSTLTFDLSNKGTGITNSVRFTDTLPANVVIAPTPNVRTSCPTGGALGTALGGMTVTATPGTGSIAVNNATVNAGSAGAALTCQITVNVTSNTVGVYHNTNASISNINNLVNLVGDEVLTVVQPQLTASKSVVGALAAGQTGAASDGYFNIGVQNTGSGATSGAITIADTLPAGFSLVSASSAQGAVSCGTLPATGTVTCSFTPTAPIAAGDSASVRLNVAIAATATGSPVNHVAVAGGGDPDPLPACPAAGNPQCAQTPAPIAVNVSLSLVKSELPLASTYTPGRSTTYTLHACNANGPAVANGATLSDPLPKGVTLSGAWSCAGTGGGTCPANGGNAGDTTVALTGLVLPVGACVDVQVPVTFDQAPATYY